MTLRPLPVLTRVYEGEGISSYAGRLAQRNHSDIKGIELGVRRTGVRLPHRRWTPERVAVWRELGGPDQHAFAAPETIEGSRVTDRDLCLQCAQGHHAMGRLPGIGMVCLKHRRWIGFPQIGIHHYRQAIAAERHYRRHLAPRGILFDSFPMDLGRGCASPAFIGFTEIQRRCERIGINNMDVITYPERVQFARLLTLPRFLEYVTEPSLEARVRRDRITDEVAKILPHHEDCENWRAVERIWDVVRRLTTLRRDSRLWGAPVRDTHYQLLRFVELEDWAKSGEWGLSERSIFSDSVLPPKDRVFAQQA
ncbi:hypothetical protein [Mycobacteroides abscessus]|uniref:hypothetical protein n=1 Tax=Mycobacteroides abscessus TaxID=36809 RepID=UPI0010553AA4|nr:hypothetical protein [Mycobacteroides abscessus]